ncbi:polysaccharide deacetylase family protein [Lachnoclostridium phytofermentans]|uniref:Polysaccharide deacetylase n=1 Tax=Lachnoclostridium phytofermentans (strain ATCC 700394 / DSM 18823 / ISDg) TaxID=357809 RepID=A9KSS7_LACP7|nr:hypothetical protein [Lachnoclostridium phytofermentans]ABX40721.1 hypothetical protein Cphy_0334 [Lachnoclostridium phytofermentans ISDg]
MDNQKKPKDGKITLRKVTKILIMEGLILSVLFISFAMKRLSDNKVDPVETTKPVVQTSNNNITITPTADPMREVKKEQEAKQQEVLKEAKLLAAGYDYDKAINMLKSEKGYENVDSYMVAINEFEEEKKSLVPLGAYKSSEEVSHLFFHSLIYDTSKAFDGDYKENGYNYYMVTVKEFKEMLRQLYENNYVLVSVHDLVTKVTKKDGTTTYQDGEILLPPNKKPFVLSQDDVNYYDYMDGDGFASRMVIDENGKPSTLMINEDGTTTVGDYDMVPIVERFIEEHPDFSYRGARGIIALTGYEGALGYRTDPASKNSKTYAQDKETVKQVAEVMKQYGWEFASHSNGHRDMGACTEEFLKKDTDKWLKYVGSLVGETDLYIFPYGIDIQSGAGTYKNAKFQYLDSVGFHYYFGVFKEPWIQVKDNYVRMSRRAIDGQAMLQYPERLKDIFDLSTILDDVRPALK